MRPLSASEAISPAIDRTKAILFQPFRKGRSWKLGATAYLAVMGLAFIPTPLIFFGIPRGSATSTIISATIGIVLTGVLLVLFYAGSRLQFVLFAIVSEKREMVAPLWNRYGSRTWRWLILKLILSLVVFAIFGVPIFYRIRSLIPHIQPGQPPTPEMFTNILLLYVFILTPMAFLMLCSSLLSDFVLPPIALEDATVSDAAGRFFQLIKSEPGQVVAYICFKVLLAIAGLIAMEIVVLLTELVAAIPLGLLALLGWFLFRSSGPVGHLLFIVGGVILLLIFTVFVFYVTVLVLGCVHMFLQAYATYFLGGRYPLLGDLLDPPAPTTLEPPPQFEPAT
jgi:hypothetical protein